MTEIGAAGVKATGTIAGALISRSRPSGIARAGSREDRLQAYRHFLDALMRYVHQSWICHATLSEDDVVPEVLHAREQDLVSALYALRLCAPIQVLTPAEVTVRALPTPMSQLFMQQERAFDDKVALFLTACRRDLDFNYRPWQIWRWHKLFMQRRYMKKAAALEAPQQNEVETSEAVALPRGEPAG